jgi:hypothetical protein
MMTTGSRQALAEANNRAAALERQLAAERETSQGALKAMHAAAAKATASDGDLRAEKAARLADRQHTAEITAAYERQLAAGKEQLVREQRKFAAVSRTS